MLSSVTGEVATLAAALDRIEELERTLEASRESPESEGHAGQFLFPGDLELIGVTHRYHREGATMNWILRRTPIWRNCSSVTKCVS